MLDTSADPVTFSWHVQISDVCTGPYNSLTFFGVAN
jgi:hypothetical protein